MERLDKILSIAANLSRSEAKAAIRRCRVELNGKTVTDPDLKVGECDEIRLDGETKAYRKFVYIMMNKPEGVVSATEDGRDKTAVDLVTDKGKRRLFPAGRLDKNTTGFLLLTDDGDFAHRILSPSKHVEKEYEVTTDKPIPKGLEKEFREGVDIGDYICKPAVLNIRGEREAVVILREGKYHQIKRMFSVFGIKVESLKRTRMGNLRIDESLRPGEYKWLSKDEVVKIAQ